MNIHSQNTSKTLVPAVRGAWPKGIVPSVVKKSLDTYIVLPAFILSSNLSHAIPGNSFASSFCTIQFNYSLGQNFSFKTFPLYPPVDSLFCLIVRYHTSEGTFRFKLWSNVGEYLVFYPEYAGEIIPGNFTLECWNIINTGSTLNPADLNILISPQVAPARGATSFDPVKFPQASQVSVADAGFVSSADFPEEYNPLVAFISNN